MTAWMDYKNEARDRGALALELFVVRSVPAQSTEALRAILPAHLEYQAAQEAAGTLVFAGPVSDPTGTAMEGEGLIIYRAANLGEARKLAEADPMHRSGARRYDLRRWLVNEGSLSVDIGLSGQSVTLR